MSVDHETGVLKFVLPRKRKRLAEQIANPKRRRKALETILPHLRDLDRRYAYRVPPAEHSPTQIATVLQERGAPSDCYVISEDPEIDAKTMPLADALTAIVGFGMGSLVSCVPGRLGYFEGEEPGERYILVRPRMD